MTTAGLVQPSPQTSWLFKCYAGSVLVSSLLAAAFYIFGWLAPWSFAAELATHFHFQNFWLLFWSTILLAWTPFRRWRWIMISITLMAAATALVAYIPLPPVKAQGPTLRLMTFNVLGSNQDVEAVLAEIRRQQPEVLVLQEYTARWHQDLAPRLDEFPHRALHPRWHGFGIAIYSKFPLERSTLVPLTKAFADIPALVARVSVADCQLTIVGVHTASPMSSNRLRLRNQQMSEIADLSKRLSAPLIVVGDFNCTPWSPYFREFLETSGLHDSRLGFGHQGSWSEWPFLPIRIPIDHALVSPEISVHSRRTGSHAGSDHRPIVLDLQLPSPQQPLP